MLIVVSPAKTLDYESPLATEKFSQPELAEYSKQLIEVCRKLTPADVASLMKVSDKIADLNVGRFQEWSETFTADNSRQAILAFKGDVYTGLDAQTLSEDDFDYAQSHLRMLSGLYGLLKPLDLMQPYRLEMGTKLANDKGTNLYQFWGNVITDKLNQAISDRGGRFELTAPTGEYEVAYWRDGYGRARVPYTVSAEEGARTAGSWGSSSPTCRGRKGWTASTRGGCRPRR